MPDLKTKQQIVDLAQTLARDMCLVQRGTTTYIPAHWETLDIDGPFKPEETVWIPLTHQDKRDLGNHKGNILFYTDGDLRSFNLVLSQFAENFRGKALNLLVRTDNGLKVLNSFGMLVDPTGQFVPNYIRPKLNEDEADQQFVFDTIKDWLGGDEDTAHSLLYHLATSLAPGYSAVKYIILLGEGRNGKGTLLTMITKLFGEENISGVSRQEMSQRRATIADLNDKLLNVVFDGQMEYIRDSSTEKTIVAGEPLFIEMKYENAPTKIQTNALFIEALNLEPKARDKSSALQKRLVRFSFPNIYAVDKSFEKKMTSERVLGAFLGLLIKHFVREDELATKLQPTAKSIDLQLEQMWLTNPMLQYMEHLGSKDPKALENLATGKVWLDDFLNSFKPWAETQGMQERSDGDLVALMKSAFVIESKTRNKQGKRSTQRYIKSLRHETELVYGQIKGGTNGTGLQQEALVRDGQLLGLESSADTADGRGEPEAGSEPDRSGEGVPERGDAEGLGTEPAEG
ncbi:DNA helicase [Microbacterium phage Hannabella]|nr:DNA helicase [Microbacterium phage Hannabella]